MLFKENLRVFFFKTFIFSLVSAIFHGTLYLILEVCLDLRIHSTFWLIWLPAVFSLLFWLFYYGERISSIQAKANTFLLQVLAIVFFAFPSGVAYLVAYDLTVEVKTIDSASDIDPGKSHTVWKVGRIDFGDRYGNSFVSTSGGKSPSREFDAVIISRIKSSKSDLWMFTSTFSSVSTRSPDSEIEEKFQNNYEENLKKEKIRFENTQYPVYLTSVKEGADSRNCRQLLLENKIPFSRSTMFYNWSQKFEPGLQETTFWLVVASLSCCFTFFFLTSFSISAQRKVSYVNLFASFVISSPMTTLLMLYAMVVFIIVLTLEPNILALRNDTKIIDLMVSKRSGGEWYRIFTAPFADFNLILKMIGLIILFYSSTMIEKFTSITGFIVLTLGSIIVSGIAAMYFSPDFCYGPHVIYVCYGTWYASKALQPRFAKKMYGGVIALVGVLVFIVVSIIPDVIDPARLSASIVTGLLLSLFVKVNTKRL